MRERAVRWLWALILFACPAPTDKIRAPLPHHVLNGLWGSLVGPEEILLFGTSDGGLAWSPRRVHLLDGGLTLTHHCRDLAIDATGRLVAQPGTFSAGPAIGANGGFSLRWTASTEALTVASANIDCGGGRLGAPVVSGQFLDASVTIRIDWVESDGGLAHSERIEFTAQRRTRCE